MGAVLVVALLVLVTGAMAKTETLYVAPSGNDAWDGLAKEARATPGVGPVATLGRAVELARALKQQGGDRVRIVVRGGKYFLDKALALTPADSGLRIEAAAGEEAVLYAGRRLTGWQPEGQGLYSCPVPEAQTRQWDFRMLTVNGVRARRARLPETGTFEHVSDFKVRWMSTTGGGWERKPTDAELTTMIYKPGDLGPWLDVNNAEVTVYHMWDESMVGVKALDDTTHTITFSSKLGHPPGGFNVHKYVVWNVREGLKAPGQWYLDRTAGKVVYWPLPGQDMKRVEVLAPTAESIFTLIGNKDQRVKDITLRGLRLAVTTTPLKSGGFGAGVFAGAVQMAWTEDCRLSDLTIFNTGGQGIRATDSNSLTVEGCEVRNAGACGIRVSGQSWRVINNYVHHNGEAYPSAIAVNTGGQDGLLAHNEVHDCPYSGITFGGQGAVIEANEIYRTMQELHDGAAIYITFCKNVTVRGNYVHDVTDTGGYGASAYYLDEQAEDCLVEGNLSTGVGWPSHNHMTKHNTLRGNVWVVEGDAKLTFPKSTDCTLERNIVTATGKITVTNPPAITTWTENIFYTPKGPREGVPAEVLNVDPLLENPAKGVWRLKAGSPAAALGLTGVDVSGAGRVRTGEQN